MDGGEARLIHPCEEVGELERVTLHAVWPLAPDAGNTLFSLPYRTPEPFTHPSPTGSPTLTQPLITSRQLTFTFLCVRLLSYFSSLVTHPQARHSKGRVGGRKSHRLKSAQVALKVSQLKGEMEGSSSGSWSQLA